MKPLILKGHTRPLTCVKYNAEGDLLFTAAKDASPTVWFTDSGERLGTFTENGHRGTVWSIDVDQSSLLAITGGGDHSVKVWVVETGVCIKTWEVSGPVRVVEWAEGGQQFVAVADPFNQKPGVVRIFDMPRNQLDLTKASTSTEDRPAKAEWTVEGLPIEEKITVAAFAPLNEALLTGDSVGTIRWHHVASGNVLRKIEAHAGRINCLSWDSTKTMFITGGADCRALLIDGENLSVVKKYESNTPVNAAVISPIKEHVLVAGGQEAMEVTTTSSRVGKFETKFFHLVFQEEWGSVKGHFGPVNALAMHPEGTGFVSGSEDGYVRLHKFDKDYFKMHSEFDDLTALEELAKDKQ